MTANLAPTAVGVERTRDPVPGSIPGGANFELDLVFVRDTLVALRYHEALPGASNTPSSVYQDVYRAFTDSAFGPPDSVRTASDSLMATHTSYWNDGGRTAEFFVMVGYATLLRGQPKTLPPVRRAYLEIACKNYLPRAGCRSTSNRR
jgi:hypothetical protein